MDEENDEKLERGIERPKKKKGKRLVLIIIAAAAVIGGGAFFFLSMSHAHTAQEHVEAVNSGPGTMFALDPFVVNLDDQGGSRFLKVAMQMELSGQAAMDKAKARTPQIRDAVIGLLTSETSDALMSADGKQQLKDEINLMVSQVLGDNTVKNIYFTDFVMQ